MANVSYVCSPKRNVSVLMVGFNTDQYLWIPNHSRYTIRRVYTFTRIAHILRKFALDVRTHFMIQTVTAFAVCDIVFAILTKNDILCHHGKNMVKYVSLPLQKSCN